MISIPAIHQGRVPGLWLMDTFERLRSIRKLWLPMWFMESLIHRFSGSNMQWYRCPGTPQISWFSCNCNWTWLVRGGDKNPKSADQHGQFGSYRGWTWTFVMWGWIAARICMDMLYVAEWTPDFFCVKTEGFHWFRPSTSHECWRQTHGTSDYFRNMWRWSKSITSNYEQHKKMVQR